MAYAHNNQLGPLFILIVVTTNWLIVIVSIDYQSLGTIDASMTHTTDIPSQWPCTGERLPRVRLHLSSNQIPRVRTPQGTTPLKFLATPQGTNYPG